MRVNSSKRLMFASGFLTIITAIMSVMVAFLLKMIIDAAMTKNLQTLIQSIYISIGYIIVYFVISYLKEIMIAKHIKDIMEKLKRKVYQSIMDKNYQSFFDKSSGEYISILTNDMTAIEDNYYKGIYIALQCIVCFLVALASLFLVNWKFALGLIGISVIFMMITSITGLGLNGLRVNVQNQMADFTSKIKDLISGYEMIRSFNAQERMQVEFDKKNQDMEQAKVKFNIRLGVAKVINENLVILIVFAILALGSLFVIKGDLVIGSLIAVIQLLNSIMNPINLLFVTTNNMKSTKAIRQKAADLISDENRVNHDHLITKSNFSKAIKLKNLNFSYTSDKKIIDDLTLEFEKGKNYAIVGESGCGKSTLLKLVQNYYEHYTGTIEIDEINYKEINDASFFNLFSFTHQNVFIFAGTIRDNITLFRKYSDGEIDNAITKAGLKNLVNSLPKGLDTNIHENGNTLSGGEKQRISIARAIIKNTPILILDESTSALDKKTSNEVEKSVLSLQENTCIAVTHKLNDETKKLYDKIIYLNRGNLEKIEDVEKLEWWI